MPMVEIDEAELTNHRNVTNTMAALLGNPKTRGKVLAAVKEINPAAAIPEIDAAQPVIAEMAQLRKQLEDFRSETAKEKAERENAAKLADLRVEWNAGHRALETEGYTPDAIKAIEEMMEKEGIRSHKIAAAAYSRLNPEPAAISSSSRYVNPVLDPAERKDNPFLESLLSGDSESALDTQIATTLRDVRGVVAA